MKNKSYIAVCSLVSICLSFTPVAFCSDLTGQVGGPSGPVAGAQVTVTDASGKVVGQGTTNDAGRYCITGIDPGSYKTTVNPPAGFQPGATNSSVPAEGLTEDWSLSPTVVASSSSNPPGTCGAAYLGSPFWWAGGALLVGGAVAACGLTCFSGGGSSGGGGGGGHPITPSR